MNFLKSYQKRMPNKTPYQVYKNLMIRNLCLMRRCFGKESEVPKEIMLELSTQQGVELNEKTRVNFLFNFLEGFWYPN